MRRKRVWVAALQFALPLLLAELVLQTIDPFHFGQIEARERFSDQLLHPSGGRLRLIPSRVTSYLDKPVTINSRRLRHAELAPEKPPGTFRILLLGDSLAFGWGVGDDEHYGRLLERELNARAAGPKRQFEVVNAASPGADLVAQYVFLQQEGLAMAPDLVLHAITAHDLAPRGKAPWTFLNNRWRRVRLLRLFENAWIRATDRGETEPGTGVAPEMLIVGLNMLHQICSAAGTRYVYLDMVGVEAARKHCESAGITRVAVPITQAWINEHQVNQTDFHPRPAGHRWIAEQLLPQLLPILSSR